MQFMKKKKLTMLLLSASVFAGNAWGEDNQWISFEQESAETDSQSSAAPAVLEKSEFPNDIAASVPTLRSSSPVEKTNAAGEIVPASADLPGNPAATQKIQIGAASSAAEASSSKQLMKAEAAADAHEELKNSPLKVTDSAFRSVSSIQPVESRAKPNLESSSDSSADELLKDLIPEAPAFQDVSLPDPPALTRADSKAVGHDKSEKNPSRKLLPFPESRKSAESPAYVFADHLREAELSRLSEDDGRILGRWENDRFVILSGPEREEIIRKDEISAGGEKYSSISLRPTPAGVTRLRFSEIPAFSGLKLRYGWEDLGSKAPPKASVYIKIWLGQHELKRIRYYNQKIWRDEFIPVGPGAFLKTPMIVTLEFQSDEPLQERFSLFAETRE